jgi:hypothetical protein
MSNAHLIVEFNSYQPASLNVDADFWTAELAVGHLQNKEKTFRVNAGQWGADKKPSDA